MEQMPNVARPHPVFLFMTFSYLSYYPSHYQALLILAVGWI